MAERAGIGEEDLEELERELGDLILGGNFDEIWISTLYLGPFCVYSRPGLGSVIERSNIFYTMVRLSSTCSIVFDLPTPGLEDVFRMRSRV